MNDMNWMLGIAAATLNVVISIILSSMGYDHKKWQWWAIILLVAVIWTLGLIE